MQSGRLATKSPTCAEKAIFLFEWRGMLNARQWALQDRLLQLAFVAK
jgi:hypothetical protein